MKWMDRALELPEGSSEELANAARGFMRAGWFHGIAVVLLGFLATIAMILETPSGGLLGVAVILGVACAFSLFEAHRYRAAYWLKQPGSA